jgi:hypothetical protein
MVSEKQLIECIRQDTLVTIRLRIPSLKEITAVTSSQWTAHIGTGIGTGTDSSKKSKKF